MVKLGQRTRDIVPVSPEKKLCMINLFLGVYILPKNCTACLLQHVKASGR